MAYIAVRVTWPWRVRAGVWCGAFKKHMKYPLAIQLPQLAFTEHANVFTVTSIAWAPRTASLRLMFFLLLSQISNKRLKSNNSVYDWIHCSTGTHSGCGRVVTGGTLADGRVLRQVVVRCGQQQRQHRVASDVVHAEPVTTSSGSVADTQYLPEQNTKLRLLQFSFENSRLFKQNTIIRILQYEYWKFKVIGADERLTIFSLSNILEKCKCFLWIFLFVQLWWEMSWWPRHSKLYYLINYWPTDTQTQLFLEGKC